MSLKLVLIAHSGLNVNELNHDFLFKKNPFHKTFFVDFNSWYIKDKTNYEDTKLEPWTLNSEVLFKLDDY